MIRRTTLSLVLITLMSVCAQTQTWRLLIPVQAYTMRVNHQDPNKLYIGNWSNQMYRSNDGGSSWEIKEIGSVSSGNYVTSMFTSTADTNVILAAGYLFNGIRRSSDGGSTWTTVLRDSTNRRQWFVSEAIIEDPKDPTVLYAARGTTYNTVFKSVDTGKTWDSISVIDMEETPRLCTIAARADSTNIIFLGCKWGVIMRSDDAGITWRRVPVDKGADSLQLDSEIPKIVFSTRDPMVGYAIVAIAVEDYIKGNGGVLKTVDGGATWNRIAYSDTSFWAVESRPTPDGLNDDVFVGGFRISTTDTVVKGDSLVFRSIDGGDHWTEFKDIPWQENEIGDTIRNVWSIRYDTVGKKMYMATVVGLYVLDEISSVNESPEISSTTLSVSTLPSTLLVTDAEPFLPSTEWGLYTMSGSRAAHGIVEQQGTVSIDVSALPQGRYLLTWGTRERLRTALISLIR